MSARCQEWAYMVACKDEFATVEQSGDSADGRNRDSFAKTSNLPPVGSSKGTLTTQKKKQKHV